jgi:hypothetical protein
MEHPRVGIAVDISSAYEPMRAVPQHDERELRPSSGTTAGRWGLDFCDPMHFQYAYGY